MRLDLRASTRTIDLELPAVDQLSASERKFAIDDWLGRMGSEHASARVFAALVPQLMHAEIEPAWQAEVAAMIGEELRHARLCADVVVALGGSPVVELPRLEDVPQHEDAAPLEALLRNVISISCLHETVAVAVIGATRHAVTIPALSCVMTSILADEVGHARFGWRLLQSRAGQLSAQARDRLSSYLVPAFRSLRDRNHLDIRHRISDDAGGLGVCDGRDATEVFFHTVEQVIIPGLEEHGLAARASWLRSAA